MNMHFESFIFFPMGFLWDTAEMLVKKSLDFDWNKKQSMRVDQIWIFPHNFLFWGFV